MEERLYFILDMGDNSSRLSTLVSGTALSSYLDHPDWRTLDIVVGGWGDLTGFLFTAVVVSLSCFILGTGEVHQKQCQIR